MVNQRKERIGGGEFIGFGAFAAPAAQQTTWSPVYTGTHEGFRTLLTRVAQKTDGRTVSTALQDLSILFESTELPKRVQIDALSHYAYLYYSKLGVVDANASVRAFAITIWTVGYRRIPKAVKSMCERYPELLGMLYSAQADPSAEVRNVENGLVAIMTNDEWPWQEGIDLYTTRILSYGRPSAMDEALFPKRAGDADRDQMEERYDRLVGTCLDVLVLYMRDHPSSPRQAKDIWWKTFSSSKPTLRRKTYQLAATVAAVSPTLADGVREYFSPALASEKDANNVPILLEALLTVLVKGNTKHDTPVDDTALIKGLSKVFKKACYQASVEQWGPMLLPIVSRITTLPQQQLVILQAAQTGVDVIVADADKWRLWTAICESAHVCSRNHDDDDILRFNEIWNGGLEFALTTESFHRTARVPRSACLEGLAKELGQKSLEKMNLDVMLKCPISPLTDFISVLLQQAKSVINIPQLKQRFHTVVGEYQNHSGAAPSIEAYRFISAALKYQGPDELFKEPDALNSFVMSHLLRWTVLHTSSLSDQRSDDSAAFDFELLAQCLNANESLWEPFLREILAAKADLLPLTRGLEAFVSASENGISMLQCDLMDSFSLDIASASACRRDEDMTDSGEQKEVAFFRFCLKERNGLSVASAALIEKWVEVIQIDGRRRRSSSILQALAEACAYDYGNLFAEQHLLRVSTAAWMATQSEHVMGMLVETILGKPGTLRDSFLGATSAQLRLDLSSEKDDDVLSTWCKRWISLWKCCTKWNEILPRTGLESLTSWKSDTNSLYMALSALLRTVDKSSDRLDIIRNIAKTVDLQTAPFLGEILPLLSDASPSVVDSTKSRLRKDHAASLIEELFRSDEQRDDAYSTAKVLLTGLANELKFQGVAILSQLLSFLLPPITDPDPDEIVGGEVLEEEKLWYIRDEARPENRVLVKVLKVHHDATTGYYFTIKIDDNTEDSREKQTLASRLRRRKTFSDEMKVLLSTRMELRNMFLSKVLPQHAASTERSFGDLISVVVHQIGLGREKGIGSPRYEVLRVISSLHDRAMTALTTQRGPECSHVLFQSALCLGFGFSIPQYTNGPEFLGVSVLPLANALANQSQELQTPEFALDLLPWLVAVLPIFSKQDVKSDVFAQILNLLFSQVTLMLSSSPTPDSFLIACRAIECGIRHFKYLEKSTVLEDICFSGAFAELLKFYLTAEAKLRESMKPITSLMPEFDEILIALQRSKQLRIICSTTLRAMTSAICQNLLQTNEPYRMHLLLNACAIDGVPFRDEENATLSKGVEKILSKWIDGMGEEEAAEVEVDMDICSKWIPDEFLLRLENWDEEEDFTHIRSDRIIEGSFLWLSFLNFVKSAIPTDYRVRPAFVSFLDKCGALNHALNLSVLYDGWVDIAEKEAVADLVGKERIEFLDPSMLVSSVIFRTMTVFPSLTRRWWEEYCPKVYVQPIQRFVENVVSPEILRRELDQMKSDSAFGGMTVSASLVSRQITATYVQDEFKLKVLVTVPKSFPLRSAEVDCSQTLGVPENRWKRWSLQIRQMLNNQGGTLRDALILWKDNVDKEFEGIEPCPVCYSVLHVKTHKLPSLECSTCHNRFHFDCLTQWFKSSGKNQCVLCQQQWRGTRV